QTNEWIWVPRLLLLGLGLGAGYGTAREVLGLLLQRLQLATTLQNVRVSDLIGLLQDAILHPRLWRRIQQGKPPATLFS
ncbi:MAG: hypothetical protein ACKPKO_01940, partial [Candidatus Fonsibacter sp.]